MTLQKQLFLFLLLLFFVQYSSAQKFSSKLPAALTDSIKDNYYSPNQISTTDSIINYGKLFLETPYRYGASGTSSFDCSGFTSYVFSNFGYDLDRCSADQAKQFEAVEPENVKAGDLVFFSGRHKSHSRVGHVGIVVSANDDGAFDFIHASVQKGVTISNSDESYYKNRFVKVNRVVDKNKMLSVVRSNDYKINSEIELASNPATIPVTSNSKIIKKVIPAQFHNVKSGENLTVIADKFGVTVADLKRINNLNDSKIKPSQRLKVRESATIVQVDKIELADNKTNEKGKKNKPDLENTTVTSLHTVVKGESLFSISKAYNISIDELKRINNLNGSSIHFGDVLKLNSLSQAQIAKVETPKKDFSTKETQTADLNAAQLDENTTHIVSAGESLYSISKKYNVSIDKLKEINQLATTKLSLGQSIMINEPQDKTLAQVEPTKQITHKVGLGESFYSIARNYGCTINDLKSWNNKTDNNLHKGDRLIVYPKTI